MSPDPAERDGHVASWESCLFNATKVYKYK